MRDAQGIELQQGDQIHLKIGLEWIVGTIVKIQNGGIAVSGMMPKPGENQIPVTPDMVVIQLAVNFSTPPGMPHGEVVKLASPQQANTLIQ
jgi:hypothetical protein